MLSGSVTLGADAHKAEPMIIKVWGQWLLRKASVDRSSLTNIWQNVGDWAKDAWKCGGKRRGREPWCERPR
jgi:hypothetical protein